MKNENTQIKRGNFYTPLNWVDECIKELDKNLGLNWKDEYIVWDNSAGEFNLTKNHKFKYLYSSTINQEDIDYAIKNNINPGSIKFQFDFLNDDIFGENTKVPMKLQEALRSKKVLFFINPPYVSGNTMGTTKDKLNKKGISKTEIQLIMKENKMGRASSNYYTQFLYRIFSLNKNGNITIACLTPSLYKTGTSFEKFRELFYTRFKFDYSFLFNCKYFDVKSSLWAIDFTIWKPGIEKSDELMSIVKDIKDNEIISIGKKIIYNLDHHEKRELSEEEKPYFKKLYQQYNNDAIIYSLFNKSSQQSSLRQIDYKDKKWDIINEFFWMSREDMMKLAIKYDFKEMIDDITNTNKERFVYEKLKSVNLSIEIGRAHV